MPATEQTWRDSKLLHQVFGVSSLLLLIATIWMFAKDHDREWKQYQSTARHIDIVTTDRRALQFATDNWVREHAELQGQVRLVQAQGIDPDLIERFRAEVRNADEAGLRMPGLGRLDGQVANQESAVARAVAVRAEANPLRTAAAAAQVQLDEAHQKLADARQAGDDPAVESARAVVTRHERDLAAANRELEAAEQRLATAETEVVRQRSRVLAEMNRIVADVRYQESALLQDRKFEAANLDAANADLDIAIRDDRTAEFPRVRQRISGLAARIDQLTLDYQAVAEYRRILQDIAVQTRAKEDEMAGRVAEHRAEKNRLERALADRRANFVEFAGPIPLPGKRWLEMPILDAFNSPRKIDNLWSDGLEQNYNFGNVRRFDRCTTCHQAMEKTMAGTADKPAYTEEKLLTFIIDPRRAEEPSAGQLEVREGLKVTVDNFLGVMLEDRGLIRRDDVTISFIKPDSLAAKARLRPPAAGQVRLSAEQLRQAVFDPNIDPLEAVQARSVTGVPGLLVGDVIERIAGDPIRGRERAAFRFEELERAGRPFELTVRRGLPHPYNSHPRLDLFVGSLSPHKVADFACTICHDGQGSATDFKWASHTPNTESQRKAWTEQHGWFDNHHWIYPMNPERFIESTCLKCHHNVVELQPSVKFPDPPAAKLMHGYDVIRKYGCYGCHEVNGFDGPDRRIGPDLRMEPQFYAAALEIAKSPYSGFDNLADDEQSLVQQLADQPENDGLRRRVLQMLRRDAAAEEPRLSEEIHSRVVPLLRDVDVPGQLRKPGPSLRYINQKADNEFLFDWIRDPQHFRPSTRMPKFFGLYDHLEDHHDADASHERIAHTKALEEMEILGLVRYLNDRSQPFDFIEPPEGIDESSEEERAARGQVLFQERGCLACHTHKDFAGAAAMIQPTEIMQGPDLSGVADKFDPQRNPNGARWLYTWIKNPTEYHSRTVMPDLILEPIQHRDLEGNVTMVTDPVADIVAYLMASSSVDWQPLDPVVELNRQQRETLDELALEHLREAFFVRTAQDYLKRGIPESRRVGLKAAELDLVVSDADWERRVPLTDDRKLTYLGKKSIAKYGCYGCHDIPGFEDAKPIGTGLADWGRKDPTKLAFEHITHYVHGHAHSTHAQDELHGPIAARDTRLDVPLVRLEPKTPPFFEHHLKSHNRIGFLYQKLREPRSYDYAKTDNKRYNERLRMPQFPFNDQEREAVMTFVLGLVAEPPNPKYVYAPDERERALIEGRVVLEKYNCGGCHIIEPERWDVAYPEGQFGNQRVAPTYPFVATTFSPDQIEQALQRDRQGLLHATLVGIPAIGDDGLPIVNDDEGDPVEASDEEARFDPATVEYAFQLLEPTILDGASYQVSESAVTVPASQIQKRHEMQGGYLTRYLLPYVVAREKQLNPQAKGSEAWGWLPPPLVGQGNKVQAEWLYQFLLNPHAIRPAVVLRMPKFNMSTDEATALVNYFAARDNAHYPYEYSDRRRSEHLASAERSYRQRLDAREPETDGQNQVNGQGQLNGQNRAAGRHGSRRLEDAMQIVVDNNYCVKCHSVGDFVLPGPDRAKAPDLAVIHQRMRSDYLRQWLAKPTSILPYTSMPVNIPYDPEAENLGGIGQHLYHGTSIEQLDAVVDLLMNYDAYAKQQTNVSSLVEAARPAPEDEQAPEAEAADPAAAEAAADAGDRPAADLPASELEAAATKSNATGSADSVASEPAIVTEE